MYTQIKGMMSAEEAADALEFHASNIAAAIKRNDNCVFENRATSLKAILHLLGQYAKQTDAAKQPPNKSVDTTLEYLREVGGSFADCVAFFGVDSDENKCAVKAKEIHAQEGKIEVDSTTIVSESDDGAYVMAWLWVGNDNLNSSTKD